MHLIVRAALRRPLPLGRIIMINIYKVKEYFEEKYKRQYNIVFLDWTWKIMSFNEDENMIYIMQPGCIKENFNVDTLCHVSGNCIFIEACKEINDSHLQDIFNLDETEPDYHEIVEAIKNKKIEELLFANIEKIVEEKRKSFEEAEERYKTAKEEFNKAALNFEKENLSLVKETDIENIKEKLKCEIELIKKHKNTEDVYVLGEYIQFVVKNIYITEPLTERRYKIGECIIEMDIKNDNINFGEADNTETRIGYWREHQIHPHIDDTGSACFGNADAQIVQFMMEREYYAAFLTALNFLQTCNVEDVAGYAVSRWDEVDKNGNIITEGHDPSADEYGFHSSYYKEYNGESIECAVCGEEINEDDAILCSECNNYVCEDHATYIDREDRWVCEECLNEYYMRCDECGEYVRVDNVEEVDGRNLCADCIAETCIECHNCGEIHEMNNMALAPDDEYYCADCYVSIKEERGWE